MAILIPTMSARKKAARKGRECERTREEIERDGEVSSRSRSRPAPDDHCSRSDSGDRIMMGIGIGIADRRTDGADDGYARARMRGDGEEERELERGKGKRRWAVHDKREEGRARARARGCLEAWPLYDERGEKLAQTRDWHTRRGFEVQELERDYRRNVEVHPRSRSASSTRTRLPSPNSLAFGFLRPDYEDGDRNASSRKVQKKADPRSNTTFDDVITWKLIDILQEYDPEILKSSSCYGVIFADDVSHGGWIWTTALKLGNMPLVYAAFILTSIGEQLATAGLEPSVGSGLGDSLKQISIAIGLFKQIGEGVFQ
ncbi:hypothetical protein B0H13DRAFT_1894496 [Mycena leptocephala]|nr:hypothetical protein B0H13DRAFT_1894496 [Mycena leptocephala]